MILVSACLCGINTKYNGQNNLCEKVLSLVKEGKALPLCPEQLGGLKTPRNPCEICGGTGKDVIDGKAAVISSNGENFTSEFLKGAYETLKVAKACNIKEAILKSKSPSCGFGKIYDGNFSGNIIEGAGVTAELLSKNHIKIYGENDFNKAFERK
ncbi:MULTISPECIES: DUF523 domain-containing protein [Clostridium]|uniref:Uncharacterized protein n=1 Tax=Clostridium ragsdalei P11 TaxID=1353534 RepID=A0A1A6AWV7_9CLOT|nr:MULTISPECIES: DUF523 domain-containing protein [Clostridium]OBR94515.1 hypothetical protein CLRAG_14450 [Clostridium ragsdalei P11]QXE18521.1 hypothetical protein B5S50_06525 [Clostridium sp. 001]